jgi:hypothetical protein
MSERHVFVTQDYGPDLGGIARVNVERCRRLAHAGGVLVSTVSHPAASTFDATEQYPISRQPFSLSAAKRVANQIRWARALPRTGILHCGNIRPAGYPVWSMRRPYVVYVYGLDLLKERRKISTNLLKRWTLRRILGDSRGIIAISRWSAELARGIMHEAGITRPPARAWSRADLVDESDRLGGDAVPVVVRFDSAARRTGKRLAERAVVEQAANGGSSGRDIGRGHEQPSFTIAHRRRHSARVAGDAGCATRRGFDEGDPETLGLQTLFSRQAYVDIGRRIRVGNLVI